MAAPLIGKEVDSVAKRFASGALQLQGDFEPLLPAKLAMLDDVRAKVSICEGRYHQVQHGLITARANLHSEEGDLFR